MKTSVLSLLFSLAAGGTFAALPTVSNVRLTQSGSTVTIRYSLDSAPAIVTCDLEAGGEIVSSDVLANATGDVNCKVTSVGEHAVVWKIRNSPFKDRKIANVRANVKAWSLKRPPDYMVADLDNENDIRYYASSNSLPGGLFGNEAYRKSKLVMRLIRAAGVPWNMGNAGECNAYGSNYRDPEAEKLHRVVLDRDYWIGVFEVTQAQWSKFLTNGSSLKTEGEMRPVESVSYNAVRHANSQDDNTLAYYPAKPGDKSFLGLLRTKTGLQFDLPGEAQWEFACRAGTGEGEFNTGYRMSNQYGTDNSHGDHPNYPGVFPGRIQVNVTPANLTTISSAVGPTNGTAIVGSYPPSKWGTYDMHGNVAEMCLDWYAADITGLNGAVNADGANLADGTSPAEEKRVCRGGCWVHYAAIARSSSRTGAYKSIGHTTTSRYYGFRVMCELEED